MSMVRMDRLHDEGAFEILPSGPNGIRWFDLPNNPPTIVFGRMLVPTVRERKAQDAEYQDAAWTHVFSCDDGSTFEAVASDEVEARKVLKSERPGVKARYCGVRE
jgi:hypothetical protein